MNRDLFLLLLLVLSIFIVSSADAAEFDRIVIPRVRYDGGGDWYSNPTSLPNFMKEASKRLNMTTQIEDVAVSISDPDLFKYPMLYITGHGRIKFKDYDLNRLLSYLNSGGFLWVDDNYGLDKYFRREVKRLYPDNELKLLPKDHPIFNMAYSFEEGIPKIHEHDGKPPAAYAIFDKGRMTVLYTYETDIGDGLEDEGVHPEDSPEIREKAMRMAINVLTYVMCQ
jgi:hypothetical protein